MKKRLICFYLFLSISLLVNAFIIVEGFIGGGDSAKQSFSISELFIEFVKLFAPNSKIVTDPETTHYVIRKLVGHFGLFGLSGLFTTLSFVFIEDAFEKRMFDIIFVSLAVGISIAFFSELAQVFTPGRYMSFTDMLIDYAGYVGFGGLTFLFSYLTYKKKQKKEIKE